ncbi:MAG TPA: histidine phosphatase family protein [Rhodanobacteraceae bacterium]|nr:histidine phosphatase family protein [Rhodanobacteraceae bacterium]
MRDIILLRHAEAMPSSPDGADTGRPLSSHGEQEAHAAGAWLAAQNASPELALVSTARRAMMTAERALAALPQTSLRYESAIYDATPGELLRLLDECGAEQVLLVGHNPGMEQLVALLVSGQSGDFRGMPPGAIARLRVTGELEPGAATLEAFWSP